MASGHPITGARLVSFNRLGQRLHAGLRLTGMRSPASQRPPYQPKVMPARPPVEPLTVEPANPPLTQT